VTGPTQVLLQCVVIFVYGTVTLCGQPFQIVPLTQHNPILESYNPEKETFSVWAVPISLAATDGIDFSFSSSGYLDVSVRQVVTYKPMYSAYCTWESRDHRLFVRFPRIFADFHALHHLLMPRHPPCALNRLAVEILNSRQLTSKPFDLPTSRQSKTSMVLLSNDIRESQLTLLIYHK
jgi:hypothetical protein